MTPTRPGPVLSAALENFSALRAGGESAAEGPISARAALGLLVLAAAEVEARQSHAAGAWSAGLFSSRAEAAGPWGAYLRRLERVLVSGEIDLATVRNLAAERPEAGGEAFDEFHALLGESDPEFFSQSLLALAQRNLHRGRDLTFSRELLRFAQTHPATRVRAERELSLLSGGGGVLAQVEHQAPHLLRELCSPLSLFSFGTAIYAARAASVAVLARAGRFGWGTLLASEGAALAVEVPTLTFTRRLGNQMFVGGEGVFAGGGLRQELLAGYTSFGLLRAAGNGLQLAAPGLRRAAGLNQASGALTPSGRSLFETLRLGVEFGALSVGHSLNVALGLESAPAADSQPWLQSLLTLGHMRLAGRLLDRLGFQPLHGVAEAQRRHLAAGRLQELLGASRLRPEHPLHTRVSRELEAALADGRLGPLTLERWIAWQDLGRDAELASAMRRRGFTQAARWFRPSESSGSSGPDWGLEPLPAPAFAFAGVRPRTRDPRLADVFLMSMEGDNGGRGDRPEGPPTRREVVLELLRQNLTEYTERAETRDTVLGKAAKRLQDLLARLNERPDLANDEAFAKSLQEVEIELQAAQEHGSALRRSVATLKVLFRRTAASGHEALKPEVVEQKSAQLEADEAQRSAFATSLGRMQEVLQKARDLGWSEDLYAQLGRAQSTLNDFYGKTVYRIPGLNRLLRRASSPEEILQRRRGAVLGLALAAEPGFPESPVTQRLRGAAPETIRHQDVELELLHESVLLAARHAWKPHELEDSLTQISEVYRAGEETRAAMNLTAQAVNLLVQQGPRAPDLLELLKTMPESLAFHDRFLDLAALRDPQGDLRIGLQQLGVQPTAPDYLASGLLLFFRAGGDGARLTELLQAARESGAPGYHPSVAVSLFGAAHGRKAIPEALLPGGGQTEAFLIRAFPPEPKPNS
ncbi:MAG: hypothetical protein IT572_00600 [Deltaproteobacteria bacterium]|nr:hypothetical protein [Deltaproteobacteria bacterium]